MRNILLVFTILLVYTPAYAKSAYKPDDASCLTHFKKKCSELEDLSYMSCDFDPYIWDDEKRVIGVRSEKDSQKIGDLLIEDIFSMGCAHASYSKNYHFNEEINLKKITCGHLVDIWLKILKNNHWNTAKEKELYSNLDECILDPELSSTHRRFKRNESFNCTLPKTCSLGKYYSPDLMLERSTIESYQFVFQKYGYF